MMSRSMVDWARMAFKLDRFEDEVRIVIVGKYTGLQDSYLSVIKSLKVSVFGVSFVFFIFLFAPRVCSAVGNHRRPRERCLSLPSILRSLNHVVLPRRARPYRPEQHASMAVERKLDLIWVEAAHLEDVDPDNGEDGAGAGACAGEKEYAEAWGKMRSAHGVVVPGGFGTR